MIALDPRSQKALALAMTAQTWTRLSANTFRMPSQSTPGASYLVTPQMCSCKDSERHPERPCKHCLAVVLYVSLSTGLPSQARHGGSFEAGVK